MQDKFKQILSDSPKFKVGDIGYPSTDFTVSGTGRIEIIELSGFGDGFCYTIKFLDRPDKNVTLGVKMIDFMFNTEAEQILYGK